MSCSMRDQAAINAQCPDHFPPVAAWTAHKGQGTGTKRMQPREHPFTTWCSAIDRYAQSLQAKEKRTGKGKKERNREKGFRNRAKDIKT